MLRYLISLTALSVSLFCAAADINEYQFNVGQFDRIKLIDNVNVIYRCKPDSTGIATFTAEPEFSDAFILTNNGKCLKIQVNIEDVNKPNLPTLYVYSDFITSVENSSNFPLIVENPQPCPEFKAVQIGNGSITVNDLKSNKVSASILAGKGTINISGATQTAVFRMMAAGSILADRLKANTVICHIFGAGNIGCWPVDLLNAKGVGSTKIYYKGTPEIKKKGSPKIYQLPED